MRVARSLHSPRPSTVLRTTTKDTTMKTFETISLTDLETTTGGMGLYRAERLSHHPVFLSNHPVIANRVAHRLEVRAEHIRDRFGR